MSLAQLEKESDKRTQMLLDKAAEQEAINFNAKEHLSIKVIPYRDNEMIFRQQDERVSWGRKNAKYVAARHYPNAECAREIIDELEILGAENCVKEEVTNQMSLF